MAKTKTTKPKPETKSPQAASNQRRRERRAAGLKKAVEVGSTVSEFQEAADGAGSDEIRILPLPAKSLARQLLNLAEESGEKLPPVLGKLTAEIVVAATETKAQVAELRRAKTLEIARLEKHATAERAAALRASLADGATEFDTGPDALADALAELAEIERAGAIVKTLIAMLEAELGVEIGSKVSINYFGRVWDRAVAVPEVTDETTVGELRALEAKTDVVFELLRLTYKAAIFGKTTDGERSALGKVWRNADRTGPMPTLADARAVANEAKDRAAAREAGVEAEYLERRAAEKALAIQDGAAGARARNPGRAGK